LGLFSVLQQFLVSCTSQMYSIGIDIGASHIGAGLVATHSRAAGPKLEHVLSAPLRANNPEAVVEQIVEMVDVLRQQLAGIDSDGVVSALGVGCPGQIVRGTVVGNANLKWTNVPLQQLLHTRTRLPTKVLNDADAAVCAECWGNPESNFTNAALLSKARFTPRLIVVQLH
jgi:glucokinase